MANSFFQSVAPDIAAVKTVVDANSVILVDVHDTDLPAAVVKIDAIAAEVSPIFTLVDHIHVTDLPAVVTKVDAIRAIVDLIRATDVPNIQTNIDANETKIDAIQTDQFFSIIASDVTLAAADTERSHNTSTYTEVKKILIDLTGIYRITFDLKTGSAGQTAYGKIYKNDVAYGTEQTNDTESYVNKSEDLLFLRGDYVQLYLKCSTPPYVAYAQNFKVKGSGGSPVAIIITD